MAHGVSMGGYVFAAAIQRAGLEVAEIEDVMIGCSTPEGAAGRNIARQITMRGGCPVTTGA